jgi:hypothetical protein
MTAFKALVVTRLSVVLSTNWGLERETGLEPATFSLEGRSGYALWHPSWRGEHFVSSYRVFVWLGWRFLSRSFVWWSQTTGDHPSNEGSLAS